VPTYCPCNCCGHREQPNRFAPKGDVALKHRPSGEERQKPRRTVLQELRCSQLLGILFVLMALTTSAHAQSVVFTYDQWERLSAGLKEIYVSGAIDAVSTIAVPTQVSTSKYYNDCIVKKEITVHNIVEEMKVVVQSRPELHPKPATSALLAALIKLCGLPNPDLK
jgi:hypothetical protein